MMFKKEKRERFSPQSPEVRPGPSREKLTEEEIDELIKRLTGENEVRFREADSPFERVDKEDSKDTLEILEKR